MSVLDAGAPAPRFKLATEDGERFTEKDLQGERTVLVFYPFAFSPVCTDQLQLYEAALAELREQGVTKLYGVSCDSSFSQKAFREKLGVSIGQSELIVDAVFQRVPSHLFDRLMASAIPFISKRYQILKVDPAMRAGPVERNLSLVEQAHKELARHTEKVRSALRGHLLGGSRKGYCFALREVVYNPYQEPVKLVGELDFVDFPAAFRALISQPAPELGDCGLVSVRDFESR